MVDRLRKASVNDISLIESLLRVNSLPHQDISSKIDSLFIESDSRRMIGIGGVEIYDKYGLLRSLVVQESLRGKGYGKKLCDKLIQHARNEGVRELYLLTTTAEHFFERFGSERIDRKTAPTAIKNTTEFASLYPSSAICMRMRISKR